MPAPLVKAHQLVSIGNNDLRNTNRSGGPQVAEIGSSVNFDFGDSLGGNWSTPKIMVFSFAGSTASGLTFLMNDWTSSSLGDNFKASGQEWDFRIKIYSSYADPASIDPSSWTQLPWGTQTAFSIDTNLPSGVGNDGTSAMTIPSYDQGIQNPPVWWSNFYLYLALKSYSNASAGLHTGWGFRLNYVYPQ